MDQNFNGLSLRNYLRLNFERITVIEACNPDKVKHCESRYQPITVRDQ